MAKSKNNQYNIEILRSVLIEEGKRLQRNTNINNEPLTKFIEANDFVKDIKKYPHAFVLACIMDQQISADKAWEIPYRIYQDIGTFNIDTLAEKTLKSYQNLFNKSKYHRFNDRMAKYFYFGVNRIINEYDGDASKIWSDKPTSAALVYRFLQFPGVGIKIATMAPNLLVRLFRVPLADYYSIDVSPDRHIIRVFKRSGLVEQSADINAIIYKARELNPEFPGIFDPVCFQIGRNYCKQSIPICQNIDHSERETCPIYSYCMKKVQKD